MALIPEITSCSSRWWWGTVPWVLRSLSGNLESLFLSKSILSKRNKSGGSGWALTQSGSTAAEHPSPVSWLKILYVLEVSLYWALKWTWKTSRSNCNYQLAEKPIVLFQSSKVSRDGMHSWGTINLWRLKSYRNNRLRSCIGCYQN